MNRRVFVLVFLIYGICPSARAKIKKPVPYIQKNPAASKYDNPNYVRDRYRGELSKPLHPPNWANIGPQPFNPVWMDYCAPYHCNAYHTPACGLNRKRGKFQWFQSACHITLHNKCSYYRGSIKYDTVDPKFCHLYVTHLRQGCPTACDDDEEDEVCAISANGAQGVMFKNRCYLQAAKCTSDLFNEYEEAERSRCILTLHPKLKQ